MSIHEMFRKLARAAHNNAVRLGFWDEAKTTYIQKVEPGNDESPWTEDSSLQEWVDDLLTAKCIGLMHSELSEALEAIRDGNPPSKKAKGFSCLEEELADVIVRALDLAGWMNLDIGGAIVAKMKYNEGRPHKHGRKF